MIWRMELLQIRRDFPRPPNFVYKGRIIRPSSQLSSDLALPKGLRAWTDFIPVRSFVLDRDKTDYEQYEEHSRRSVTFDISSGGTGLQASTKSALPREPQSASEYFSLTERNREFMLASGRWKPAVAVHERRHVRNVMELFDAYPFADVLKYDNDFRFKRHRLQDAARLWGLRDQSLYERRLAGKAIQRAEVAVDVLQSGVPAKKPKPRKAASSSEFFDRPCYRKISVDGKGCCAKWNWGVSCVDCQPDREGSGCQQNLRHLCCFCNGEHKVKDCPDFKRLHPDDLARGYNGA